MVAPFILQPWDTPTDNVSFGVRVSDFVVQPTAVWRAVFCQRPWLSLSSPAYHLCLQEEKENAPLLEAICSISAPLCSVHRLYLDVPRFGFWAPVKETVERDLSVLISTTRDALSDGSFSRVFYLNKCGELRKKGEIAALQLHLSNQGWGMWSRHIDVEFSIPCFSSEFPFYWEPSDPTNFLDVPAPDLLRELSKQLADEKSDVAFVRRLMDEERPNLNTYLWNWKNGDLELFFEVLTLAFICENDTWDTRKNFKWQIQLPDEQGNSDGGRYFRVGKSLVLRESSAELKVAYKRVLDWFGPTLNAEFMERHLCLIRHYIGAVGYGDFRQPFEMMIQYPTEARRAKQAVKWHKWLDRML